MEATLSIWSSNIHFGYFGRGDDILDKESLLRAMNRRVLELLWVPARDEVRLVDLGCGFGATSFQAAAMFPAAKIWAVNIASRQLEHAIQMGRALGLTPSRVQFLRADYTHAPLADGEVHAAFAVESACYSAGRAKRDFLDEVFRILEPGGRFAVADGFVRQAENKDPVFRALYRKTCDYWELAQMGHIGAFADAASSVGFVDVRVQDISWNVLPSLAFVRADCLKGTLKLVMEGGPGAWSRARLQNLAAPYLQAWLCMFPQYIGYFLVSGRKR